MSEIRVALIEDHDLTRIGIRTALQQRQGIKVVGDAANATEGLKLLKKEEPDVALVDIGLPDMDGIELTQRFKSSLTSGSQPKTKVLILTFQDNEEAVLASFAAGADSFCMKDIRFEQLLEAIRVTHEGHSWIDPVIAGIVLRQARNKPATPTSSEPSKPSTVSIHALDQEHSQLLEAYPLTDRELEVLQLIVQGYSNAAIAQKLYITVGTVKTHVRNILNKLSADDRTQAAVMALRSGLVG
jgi:DNA-binding NarL/FixJ family response regulator